MKQAKKSSKFNKKILILIISLCVLLVGIVVTIIFITTKSSTPETDPRSFEEIYLTSITLEEAIAQSNEIIESTNTVEKKVKILEDRYEFMDTKINNEITRSQRLKDALLIDELDPTYTSANRLMNFHLEINDNENYERYLNIYYERAQRVD